MTENLPPHHHEAEQGALGSLLIAPGECAPILGRLLHSADFYHPAHGIVYETALRLWTDFQRLDLIVLTAALRKAGKLEAVGGAAYVTSLIDFTPTAANCEYYADLVREAAMLRQIWKVTNEVHRAAGLHNLDGRPTADLRELSSTLGRLMEDLTATGGSSAKSMDQHVDDAIERYQEAWDRCGTRAPGIMPTGLDGLDAAIGRGFHPTDLVVIAAETSGGKTALAIQAASVAALECAGQVLVCSYEMTAAQLTDRLVALASKVPSSLLRGGLFSEVDFHKLGPAAEKLRRAGLHLRDNISHWTIDDVAAEARAIKAKHGLHMVVVDYLQLAEPRPTPKGKQQNRERDVAQMSKSLKALAKELHVPVVALSQLTDGKLRESRAIGHDADVVLTIGESIDPSDKQPREDRREILINKNRHGARDKTITVGWSGPLMKFE